LSSTRNKACAEAIFRIEETGTFVRRSKASGREGSAHGPAVHEAADYRQTRLDGLFRFLDKSTQQLKPFSQRLSILHSERAEMCIRAASVAFEAVESRSKARLYGRSVYLPGDFHPVFKWPSACMGRPCAGGKLFSTDSCNTFCQWQRGCSIFGKKWSMVGAHSGTVPFSIK
jgi:hypothetical protein